MAKGKVISYNDARNFGWIAPEGGGERVFVHISALKKSGLNTLQDGQEITYDVGEGKGGKACAVNLKVGAKKTAAQAKSEVHRGRVKWFDSAKGYGFFIPEGGGADIFVHIEHVEKAGLKTLREGETFSYKIEPNPKNNKAHATELRKV